MQVQGRERREHGGAPIDHAPSLPRGTRGRRSPQLPGARAAGAHPPARRGWRRLEQRGGQRRAESAGTSRRPAADEWREGRRKRVGRRTTLLADAAECDAVNRARR